MDQLERSLERSQRAADAAAAGERQTNSSLSAAEAGDAEPSKATRGDARLWLEIGLLRDSLERRRTPREKGRSRKKTNLTEKEILEELETPRSPRKRRERPPCASGGAATVLSLSLDSAESLFEFGAASSSDNNNSDGGGDMSSVAPGEENVAFRANLNLGT